MEHLLPPLAAFVQTTYGAYIFQTCKCDQEQLASSLIFLFSIFLLLWKAKVYPTSIQCLSWPTAIVIRYLIAQYLMEYLMNAFWIPLENSMFLYIPRAAEFESNVCRRFGLPSYGVLRFMQWRIFIVLLTYMTSIMCLTTVLRSRAGASLSKSARRLKKKIRRFLKRSICGNNLHACGNNKAN